MSVITPESIAELYLQGHDRIVELVRDLSEEESGRTVPGTPDWTVHDVVAHLAAIPSDIVGGRLTGVPDPDHTGGQVAERRGCSILELIDEWRSNIGPVVELARAGLIPAPLAIDVITHEQDIRGALHAAHLDDDAALRFAVTGYARVLGRRVPEAGLPTLRLHDPARGFDTIAGEGEPVVTVTASEFELFRALAGRRSRAQVAALDWAGDPAPYLDCFSVFGPLPESDILD